MNENCLVNITTMDSILGIFTFYKSLLDFSVRKRNQVKNATNHSSLWGTLKMYKLED